MIGMLLGLVLALFVGCSAPGGDAAPTEALRHPRRIDAREAGATGDGAHDDAPALQAALDRLEQAGGVVYLPPGTYALGGPLIIRGDGMRLTGEGAVLRAQDGFGSGPLVRGRSYRSEAGESQRDVTIAGLDFDGGGEAQGAVWIERARDVEIRGNTVRGIDAGGAGTIVVRSASDDESDTGEIVVNDNVVELIDGTPTTGILLRKVVNCRVSGNRVRGSGADGSRGLDLTLSQACTVTDNVLLSVGIGCVSDGSNHLQFLGNYVFAPKTGFRAGVLTERKAWAHNNVYVNNRVLAGGQGFIVQGSGMILVGNYAAFLDPGPAIWVRKGGTHDAVVANNPSMAVAGGIRFDASDGVVAANVPISNGASGIEVRGERVAVTGNAITSCPTGIRLDPATRECTVVGNTVKNASEVPIAIAGVGHRVRDNVFADGAAPEVGPGAVYGTGTVAIESARTIVEGEFLNDRYLVSIEWAQDPGGREWIADKSSAGFVIVLPAAPPAPLSARWIARGY